MKETRVKEENFICIQGWMISKLNLKGNDLLVYAIIYGYSQDGSSWFSGSQQYIADWVNGTTRGVRKNLDSLEKRGLIRKMSVKEDGIPVIKYQCILEAIVGCSQDDCDGRMEEDVVEVEKNNVSNTEQGEKEHQKRNKNEWNGNSKQGSQGVEQSSCGCGTEFPGVRNKVPIGAEQSSQGCGTEFPGGAEQSSDNNIVLKDSLKTSSSGDKPNRAELIKSVIDHWNTLEEYGIRPVKRLSPGSIRYGMLNARITEYGYEDVIQAIENIKRSPYLWGSGDRGWRIDIEWFVKPNNFVKVWEGKYIDDQKGVKNNDNNRSDSGKYNTGNTGQASRKYSPADIYGDQWKKDFFGDQ